MRLVALPLFVAAAACRSESVLSLENDLDGDGHVAALDCNDADDAVFPGAPESCNEVDDDCNGRIDDAPTDAPVWFVDLDGDGAPGTPSPTPSCAAPVGGAAEATDCDDVARAVFPGAAEVCNDLDDDCDGDVDDDDADVLADTLRDVWPDVDEDGYGDATADVVAACRTPAGFASRAGDCADNDAAVHPDAPEICNGGGDDDCDGLSDDDDPGLALASATEWFLDRDQDGFGGPFFPVRACEQPAGTTAAATDCDDLDARVNPDGDEVCNGRDDDCDGTRDDADADVADASRRSFYVDGDDDGYGGPSVVRACEAPADHTDVGGDCADADGARHPGARETCNDVDDDCDTRVDDDDPSLDVTTAARFWSDRDGDGVGGNWFSMVACDAPVGLVAADGDCDDDDAAISPDAPEICNGYDDDCDALVDDQDPNRDASGGGTFYADADDDGSGAPGVTVQACEAPAGYSADADDCNDGDGDVAPGASEVCNDVDDDCDDRIDDLDPSLDPSDAPYFYDSDGDGFGTPARLSCHDFGFGWTDESGDCNDGQNSVFPGAVELCNSRDDDCDGATDESAPSAPSWYVDGDRDGFGTSATVQACSRPADASATTGDCDDTRPAVKPGATEVCDTLDNDCDGLVDTDTPNLPQWYLDGDGDTWGAVGSGVLACETFGGRVSRGGDCQDGSGSVNPGATEVNNDGVDNDCNGVIDFPTPLTGGILATNTTWGNGTTNTTYALSQNILVQSGTTLTIQACTTILVSANSTLQIEGTLIARGRADCPITFTSAAASPARGDWARLFFTASHVPGVTDANDNYVSGSILEHVKVMWGGNVEGAIVTDGTGSPAIRSVTVTQSKNAGLLVKGDGAHVWRSTFEDNQGVGVSSQKAGNNMILVGNTIRRNSGGGVRYSGGCCGARPTRVVDNLITDNTGAGLVLDGRDNTTWTVERNQILRNTGTGIDARVAPGTYRHNLIVGNARGMYIGYSGTHVFDRNVFALNTNEAVGLNDGDRFEFTKNTFYRNGYAIAPGSARANATILVDRNLFQEHSSTNPVVKMQTGTTTVITSRLVGNSFVGAMPGVFLNVGFPAGSPVFDAQNNYWDGIVLPAANAAVRDFIDDAALAVVDIDPVLAAPDLTAAVPVPEDLVVTTDASGVHLSWAASQATNVVGYRVWYGLERDAWSLAGTAAAQGPSPVATITPGFTLTGLPTGQPWRFAVTAITAAPTGPAWAGPNVTESWFATSF
jgi:hypothetical protein